MLIDSLEESDSSFLAKLSALSGIGRAAPDIFAEHAMSAISFVCQVTICPYISVTAMAELYVTLKAISIGLYIIHRVAEIGTFCTL